MCKRFQIIILNIFIVLHVRITLSAELQFDVLKKQRIIEKQTRGIIMSPKMDSEEWTPLGRGDPLKNDPTFDYSPPMVSKVKYWINPLHRTPDPPIIPINELSTEFNQYTATMSTSTKSNSIPKQPSDIKRYYVDYKDGSSDMSYIQLMNNKLNNKLNRPQQYQYQNHYYSPTKQPPPPLPMLVPPPPVEPNSYSSSKIENSNVLELSWDVKSHLSTTETTTNLPTTSTTSKVIIPVTKIVLTTIKQEVKSDQKTTSDKSVLQSLLGKEKSSTSSTTHRPITTIPTTVAPLTPNPIPFSLKQNTIARKPATYLIIQGHSKVKKYGGSGKLERSDVLTQDTNDINDIVKYELPKETRTARHFRVEDFLPFGGELRETFKDIATSQAEGSGIGAELTKMLFPAYVRPSTTLVYESPRMYEEMAASSVSDESAEDLEDSNMYLV